MVCLVSVGIQYRHLHGWPILELSLHNVGLAVCSLEVDRQWGRLFCLGMFSVLPI